MMNPFQLASAHRFSFIEAVGFFCAWKIMDWGWWWFVPGVAVAAAFGMISEALRKSRLGGGGK